MYTYEVYRNRGDIVQYLIDVDFGRKCTNKINTHEVYMNTMEEGVHMKITGMFFLYKDPIQDNFNFML